MLSECLLRIVGLTFGDHLKNLLQVFKCKLASPPAPTCPYVKITLLDPLTPHHLAKAWGDFGKGFFTEQ